MKYEEITSLINDFSNQYVDIIYSEKVNGVIVSETPTGFKLQLLVREKRDIEKFKEDKILPNLYNYTFEGKEKSIQTDIIEKPIFKAYSFSDENQSNIIEKSVLENLPISTDHISANAVPVRGGDSAYGLGLAGIGTAGWNIYLNGKLLSLSNWHVFCSSGNNTPIGNKVFINNSDVATLYAFEPVEEFKINKWDYALAKFNNPNDVIGEMRKCQDGSSSPYPQKLSKNVTLGDGAKYFKIGARVPICRGGATLTGIGNIPVKYRNGMTYWFYGQLIFSKITDDGDSGCIIIRSNDNTVTGLNFAGNDETTAANPLFNIGWQYQGVFRNEQGIEFPLYTTENGISLNQTYMPSFNKFDDPIPDFTKGKFLLGLSRGVVWTAGYYNPENVYPKYPPIRNMKVEYVPIAPLPDASNRDLYENRDSYTPNRVWLFLAFG